MSEAVIFRTRDAAIVEACPANSQLYDTESNTYYLVTHITCEQGIYTVYGVPTGIPELTDDSE
jgi:hypothetical protein